MHAHSLHRGTLKGRCGRKKGPWFTGSPARELSPIMHALSTDGTKIVYECVGDGDPFVLLHGFSDTRETWREAGYVERLIQRGRRSILIDCRGHGESGKPHDPNAYSGGK